METIPATDDLVIEVYDDPLLILLTSKMMLEDKEAGAVVIWPNEVARLIDALAQAAGVAAEMAAGTWGKAIIV